MKRRLLAFIIAAAMLLTLLGAACSKPANGQTASENGQTAAPGENGGNNGESTAAPGQTAEPTDEPTAEPTPGPSAEPTDEPTAEPTPEPTPEPAYEAPVIMQSWLRMNNVVDYPVLNYCVISFYRYAEIGDGYPELSNALYAREHELMDIARNRIYEIGEDDYPDDDVNDWLYLYTSQEQYIRRSDSVAFSVLYDWYCDLPEDVDKLYLADNYDTATGRKLALADVVNDPSSIVPVINGIMSRRGEDGFTLDDSVDYSSYFADPDCRDYAWTLDYNGISLFFNRNAFGIEDAWECSMFIPFSQYPDFVKAKYTAAPDEYCVAFPEDITCYFELNGQVTPVIVAGVDYNDDDDYDDPTDMYVACGSNEYNEPIDLPGFSPVYIHKNSGDFLCIRCQSFDDNSYITVLDITDGGVSTKGNFPYFWYWNDLTYAGDVAYPYYMMTPPVDPNSFLLSTRTEGLYTETGSKTFRFGDDGVPTTDDLFYIIDQPSCFKLLQPTEAELTDLSGADLGKLQLEAGDYFWYYATDGDSIAVMELEDDYDYRLVKFKIVKTEYDKSFINGILIDELFTDDFYGD